MLAGGFICSNQNLLDVGLEIMSVLSRHTAVEHLSRRHTFFALAKRHLQVCSSLTKQM